jgi:hypothetical protein
MAKDSRSRGAPARGTKHHHHDDQRRGWRGAAQVRRAPRTTWSGKTMHHPAFRVGEIKHGK